MYTINKSIATDFSGSICIGNLHSEISGDGSISTAFHGVTLDGDDVEIIFDAEPTQAEKDQVDTLIASHDSVDQTTEFVTSGKLSNGEVSLDGSSEASPVVIDGVVTAPASFVSPLSKAVARIVGEYKSDGQVAICCTERQADGTEECMNTANPTLPDTVSAWKPFLVTTDKIPNAGLNGYRVEAYLDGATTGAVRFVSVSLLKKS